MPVDEFTSRSLVAVRNEMIERNWYGTTVNKQVARVRWGWARSWSPRPPWQRCPG